MARNRWEWRWHLSHSVMMVLGFVLALSMTLGACGRSLSTSNSASAVSGAAETEVAMGNGIAPRDAAMAEQTAESISPLDIKPALKFGDRNPLLPPTVNGDRLLKTLGELQALQAARFTPKQLATTRAFLTRSLQTLGWQVDSQVFASGTNLIATWPDTSYKSQKLLVGAHYDTVAGSPGADDNGTGVAAVLEIARLFAASDRAQGLQLVFFDQEEQGLAGSLAFATPENVADLSGAVILEMLGSTCDRPGCQQYPAGFDRQALRDDSGQPLSDRGDFVAVVGDVEHPELLEAFANSGAEASPPLLALPIPFKGVLTPDVLRSDHAPFWLQGVGAVMVTDTANLRNPNYHRASDRIATLDSEFFRGVVQRVVNAIAELI